MNVFILGATGSIGSAVADRLSTSGHRLTALARSASAAESLTKEGLDTVRGNLESPGDWVSHLDGQDALIHVASTFDDRMERIDSHLIDVLSAYAARRTSTLKLLYTGGCWLYGETGNRVAVESDSFDAPASFRWAAVNGERLLADNHLQTIVIHPAMVYERNGGVLDRMVESARSGQVEIWGSADTRWPVVYRSDTALAYQLALEKGTPGTSYNVAAQSAVRVGDIADAIAATTPGCSASHQIIDRTTLIAEHGDWALGPTLDQQMSSENIDQIGWQPVVTDLIACQLGQ